MRVHHSSKSLQTRISLAKIIARNTGRILGIALPQWNFNFCAVRKPGGYNSNLPPFSPFRLKFNGETSG